MVVVVGIVGVSWKGKGEGEKKEERIPFYEAEKCFIHVA